MKNLILYDVRQLRGLTQKELARKLNITTLYYSRIETGNVIPSVRLVDLLMLELGVPTPEDIGFSWMYKKTVTEYIP
tara:strand:- start:3767 stop:3997 length:231 start_codon:yes stop_codon:yes gene_type:complete